jgi:hypothetical protein
MGYTGGEVEDLLCGFVGEEGTCTDAVSAREGWR